mgnify:CR=1 FL=1
MQLCADTDCHRKVVDEGRVCAPAGRGSDHPPHHFFADEEELHCVGVSEGRCLFGCDGAATAPCSCCIVLRLDECPHPQLHREGGKPADPRLEPPRPIMTFPELMAAKKAFDDRGEEPTWTIATRALRRSAAASPPL